MIVLQWILQAAQWIVAWLQSVPAQAWGVGHNFLCLVFKEWLFFVWGVFAAFPIPTSLSNPTLPDPGVMGVALVQLGVPQAFSIISAAFTLRATMRLIPFIGH